MLTCQFTTTLFITHTTHNRLTERSEKVKSSQNNTNINLFLKIIVLMKLHTKKRESMELKRLTVCPTFRTGSGTIRLGKREERETNGSRKKNTRDRRKSGEEECALMLSSDSRERSFPKFETC